APAVHVAVSAQSAREIVARGDLAEALAADRNRRAVRGGIGRLRKRTRDVAAPAVGGAARRQSACVERARRERDERMPARHGRAARRLAEIPGTAIAELTHTVGAPATRRAVRGQPAREFRTTHDLGERVAARDRGRYTAVGERAIANLAARI